jgi:two-component system, OmpR family, response regulator VicR
MRSGGGAEPSTTVAVCVLDESTLTVVSDGLAAEGFEVLPASSAPEALRLCRYGDPDVLALDLSLPEVVARDLVRFIRDLDPGLPIIALVPRGERALRDLGAEESLLMPFRREGLRSRIDAVLRRRHRRSDDPVRIGEILIDPGRRKILVGARRVELTKLEFDFLRVLATDPSRVFAKEELLRTIWGPRAKSGGTRVVDSYASRVRRKLDPLERRFVINHWAIGYSLLNDDAEPAHRSCAHDQHEPEVPADGVGPGTADRSGMGKGLSAESAVEQPDLGERGSTGHAAGSHSPWPDPTEWDRMTGKERGEECRRQVARCVGINLRQARESKGVSQVMLAKRIGLHCTEISLIERGKRVPRIDTLIRLADGLGVDPAQLMDGAPSALRGPLHLLAESAEAPS